MDLTAARSSAERELAHLRARAYGPGADIHLDAAALARLHELEAASGPTGVGAPGPDQSETELAHEPADEPPRSTETVGPIDPDVQSAPPRLHWWNRIPAWSLIAGAAAIGLLVGVLGSALSAPRAVAQLRPMTPAEPFTFDWYDIDRDTLVQYDDYGEVQVWTADSVAGIPCLFVAVGAEWVSMGCAPGELDPTVDLNIFTGMPALDVLDLPPGSVVRFVLRGEVVSVWTAEPTEPTPVSS
ncbi:hypothetical protein SAMN04487846_2181 [Microbacterium sp. cf046]|nr:hypothetical protein SAMN04487846_2181 [Microbacterium sp. cf046]